MAIDAGKAQRDVAVGHAFARVNVGAQIVARNAGGRFDPKDEFGGNPLR